MKIIIKQNKEGVALKTDTPMKFDEVMDMITTATLGFLNDFANKIPEEHRQTVKEAMYDNYNERASALLSEFIPDKELRPDLTAEAIKQMEDKIMKKHISKHEKQNGPIVLDNHR